MDRRREAVLDHFHVGIAGAADRQPAEEVIALARGQTAAPDGDQKRVGRRRASAGQPGGGQSPPARAPSCAGARAGRCGDPEQEQVENGEEAELEGDRDRFGIKRR